MKTKIIGKDIRHYREVSSTNELAKKIATEDVKNGLVVIADVQTSGKGRLMRRWQSPEGGAWLSILLRPNIDQIHMPKLTLLAGVVVIKTIENICDIKASLKWPNDVLIDGKKVCGILSEIAKSSKKIEYVVVGIGVNVNNDINLSGTEYPAISLKSKLGHEIILESFIIKLLENFELYYKNFLKNPELIVNEWKKHSETLGKNVKIALVKETISGIAVDLSNTGALILELNDGSIREIIAGDCIHLMPSKKKESTKKF